jgi:hypothetical protein
MKAKFIFPVLLLSSALITPAAICLQPVGYIGVDPDEAKDSAYAEGTRAINESRWTDAETIFDKIASQHGERSDAALYWKAYAQNKEGQQARSLDSCADLLHSYPKSRWTSECGALQIEIRGRSGQPVSPQSTPDDEMKLLALNALMQQDDARAMPAIRQILNGNGSDRLKERALFVLANSNTPEAQNLIGDIARGQSDPALQVRAIRMYSAIKGKQATTTLSDVYQHTVNESVKRAVLQAYMISDSQDKLVEAARTEQNPVLTKAAVQSLGAMTAVSALSQLYGETKDVQTKSAILSSLVAAGPKGTEALSNIAKTEQNPELRRKAIRNLGVSGGASAAPALVSIYQGSTDNELKKAALDGLFLTGDAHDLIALARAEKTPEMKQAIVSKLSLMHTKEATDYMMELLNK